PPGWACAAGCTRRRWARSCSRGAAGRGRPARRTGPRPRTASALNDGESAFGVRTIGVPVLRASGHVHAALALRSTSDTLTDDRLPWFLSRAQRCAEALAVLLLEPGQRY
ncbi:LOW QUALITY PROTEIN: conserved hypothetical protein, partial [Streptomyces sp. AA4]